MFSPAVRGRPGSVYPHHAVLSLGVVDYLWDLPVLHRRTVVISGRAEKEKRGLGPRGRLLDHLLHPFRAVVGVWALEDIKEWTGGSGPAWVRSKHIRCEHTDL